MTLHLIKHHVQCCLLLPIIVGKAFGPKDQADLLSYLLMIPATSQQLTKAQSFHEYFSFLLSLINHDIS